MKSRKPTASSTTSSTETNAAYDGKDPAAMEVNNISLKEDVDTLRLVALQHTDKLELVENGPDTAAPHFDPYNSKGSMPADNKPRRSIDDLRKLSAEITKTKSYSRKDK